MMMVMIPSGCFFARSSLYDRPKASTFLFFTFFSFSFLSMLMIPTQPRPCCRGRYWTGIRAACEPLFHSEQLQTYVPIANKAVDTMMNRLAAVKPDEPVEINLALAGFTMDTIGGTAFGWVPSSPHDAQSGVCCLFSVPSGPLLLLRI